MTEPTTSQLSPHELEALEVFASRDHAVTKGWVAIKNTQLMTLLAATRRLLELESALEFLDRGEGNRGTHGPDMRADALLSMARRLGWPGIESGKGGDDV